MKGGRVPGRTFSSSAQLFFVSNFDETLSRGSFYGPRSLSDRVAAGELHWSWLDMPLDGKLYKRLERALRVVDDHGTTGSRLIDDAQRLVRRVRRFLGLNLIPQTSQDDALELGCYAVQLPFRQNVVPAVGKFGRTNLK